MGLVVTCVGIPFASAQTVYPQRVLIQRQSLLGQTYVNFLNWLGFRTPNPVPVNNYPSSAGVTSAPVQRESVAQPGSADPAANGISPTSRGPVGRGGSCTGDECCGSNTTFSNGACIASCSVSVDCSTVSARNCNTTTGCRSCAQGSGGICISASDTATLCWKCLSFTSKISTPIGDVAVTSLKVGDIIWTADATGNRVVRTLLKVSRIPAINHRVVHLVLADGRTLDVSAPHPTADGRTVGDLKVGEAYDGSIVRSVVLKAYEGSATYDILPAGETGYYWANGIVMGSTLK